MSPMLLGRSCAASPGASISMPALPVLHMLMSYKSITCLQLSGLNWQVQCHQTSRLHDSNLLTEDPSV